MSMPRWVERQHEAEKKVVELQARHAYLKQGGEWDLIDYGHKTTKSENYLSGFEDAMKTLGVVPK